ncbi:hypothetical protein WN51_12655 [Melipona quadrifasciata]|uniref:Uncharacterized protein n=1 Tax=Melipona quadrifasciata TaxID=166423 RepID=A0A0N0U5F7_9HYME|nr:hypothetical protein WN51_12655 [Melipona quadrifasciata]
MVTMSNLIYSDKVTEGKVGTLCTCAKLPYLRSSSNNEMNSTSEVVDYTAYELKRLFSWDQPVFDSPNSSLEILRCIGGRVTGRAPPRNHFVASKRRLRSKDDVIAKIILLALKVVRSLQQHIPALFFSNIKDIIRYVYTDLRFVQETMGRVLGKSFTRSRLDVHGVARAKEARRDKSDGMTEHWREFLKVTYPENEDVRTATYEMLFKSLQTPEEAVTAAFVMISPFSYGDPPLCMSRDALWGSWYICHVQNMDCPFFTCNYTNLLASGAYVKISHSSRISKVTCTPINNKVQRREKKYIEDQQVASLKSKRCREKLEESGGRSRSTVIKQIGRPLASCSPISRPSTRRTVHVLVRVQLKFADEPSGVLDGKRDEKNGETEMPKLSNRIHNKLIPSICDILLIQKI